MHVTAGIKKIEEMGSDKRLQSWRTIALAVFVAVAIISSIFAYLYASNKEAEYLDSLNSRMQSSVEERMGMLSAWVTAQEDKGIRLVNSDLFRMYASDIDSLDEGDISGLLMRDPSAAPAPKPEGISDEDASYLREQLPLLERTLRSFVQLNGFLAGRVVTKSGQILINTNGTEIGLSDTQKQYIKQCVEQGTVQFAPLFVDPNRGLVWDMFMPVFPPQQAGTHVVAVMLLSVPASKILGEVTTASAMMAEGDNIRFLQKVGDEFFNVDAKSQTISQVAQVLVMDESGQLPFARRLSLSEETESFSLGHKLEQGGWWLVQESDVEVSNTIVRGFWAFAFGVALLLSLVVGLAGFALWWSRVSKRNQQLARQFYELAQQEQMQRGLLDSINASVLDFICLKKGDGEYTYVNKAMARALNRSPEKMIGHTDQEFFGYNTARRLEVADRKVIKSGKAAFSQETIFIENVPHEFQISKVPYFGEDEEVEGIVSVFRDITDMVRAQERQNKAMEGIVEAMVTAVEMIDPYLGGHSNRVKILAEAVAQNLNMSEESIATVKLAANLSQLGKMFVDRSLLEKQGVFTEEERAAMREEVQYAARILRKIDFSLPIYDTVYQMNERPDGSGYPQGLKGEQITPEATVLCVVNTFCAMIRPRSYRDGLSLEKSLEIMRANPEQNDPKVVAALEELVFSPLGDRCLASLRN